MAGYNGLGTYVRFENWTNDAAAGIKIRADRMDIECDGYATGLSTAICKDGQTTTTALIPFAAGISSTSGTFSTTLGVTGAATFGNNVNVLGTLSASDATLAYTRSQKTTGIAQSTTSDILRLLDTSGALIGNTFAQGLVYINVVDEANAANNSSYIWTYLTQGDGVTSAEFIQIDAKVRGTTLVNSFGIIADGAGGAGKFQMTTAASGKTVTARITFIGQVK